MRKNNIVAIVLILAAGFLYRNRIISWFKPRHIPASLVKSGSCEGKKLCGIVYLAPWCPACHSYEPMIKSVMNDIKNNQEHGLQVIMGFGQQPGDNEQKASEISPDVIIDNDRNLARQMGINYFPTFLVVDQKLKVKLSDADALEWLSNHAE